MRWTANCLLIALLAAAAPAWAQSENEDKLINRLIQLQTIVAVNNIAKPEDFTPDKDPNTLQVVILNDPAAKNSVSDDGEVVFLNAAVSVNTQNAYTREAFRRKAKRILAIQIPPPPNP